ncbi:MAG: PepSY-like domain-containing protein [Muribaculaceae bacterium]
MMKTLVNIYKMVGGLALTSTMLLAACSNNDDDYLNSQVTLPDAVTTEVYAEFQNNYPGAANVSWSASDGYAIADFYFTATRSNSNCSTTAWYKLTDGKRKMQCQDISFSELPEAVRTAFAESDYASWTVDERAHMLTRYVDDTVTTIYIVRATTMGDDDATQEVSIFYTEDGVAVKLTIEVVYDNNYSDADKRYHDWLPQEPAASITDYINANYPNAKYIHVYQSSEGTKVKILVDHSTVMLRFDAEENWISSETQLRTSELPETVTAAINASQYAGATIVDAVKMETAANGTYYMITLKGRYGKKVTVRVDSDGTISSDDNDDDDKDDNKGCVTDNEIAAFVQSRYPGAVINHRDGNDKNLELEITYNGIKITLTFSRTTEGYQWTCSEWDLNYRQTESYPEEIQATINTQYAEYELYYISYIETPEGDYYEVGLKKSKKSIKVKMDAQGNVLAEYGN